ncbi:MAG: amino acid adenylation domain-containing protein, partial [Bryobacteraceae bacterium]
LLIFENYPIWDSLRQGPADLRIEDVRALEPNNYPLTLVVTPGERLSLKAMYDDGRFDRATVQRLLGHYREILRSIAAAPEQRLAAISILTEEERKQIDGWNTTDRAGDEHLTVVDRFEARAAAHPDRVAVRCGNVARSYRELSKRSSLLAASLLEKVRIEPEDRIAVLMPRSELLVESILAVWKCGAAYVPIDPDYPPARIRLILENARSAAILTSDGLPPELAASAPPGTQVVSAHDASGGRMAEGRANPNGLAYVIFTSGSTGVPKGAMVEHSGMANHIRSMAQELGLGGESRLAQTASHCFDISVWQLFAALVSGGETIIYPNEVVADARELAARFEADGITAAQFVPSYLNAFLDEMEHSRQHSLSRLQWLVLIGETLKPSAVQRWFSLFPNIPLMNAYGPTEASDSITHFIMKSAPALASVPVGRPIRNMRIYILDRFSNLCPVGVKGEICVSGAGVGRGYLFDPDRTGIVFSPDPFRPQFRMYRTGDIGCYAPDGNILFFGRRDAQVKIRGHRIELGEIESALAALEGVKDAAVIAREEQGSLALVAYATPREGATLTPAQLRETLSGKLPGYMVPGAIVILPALPKTSNGKLDRKALPAPETGGTARQSIQPDTPRERALVRIWEEVLGRGGIGVTERFFEAGGHSLRAIQVASRIRSEMQIDVDLRDVFEYATIRELASRLGALSRPDHDEIPAAPNLPWYPASHTQKRIWLASRTEQGSISHNMSSALRLSGELDHQALKRAMDALVDRHESLRTIVRMTRGEIVQMVRTRAESEFRLETVDCTEGGGDRVSRLRGDEAQRAFDLENGPVFRATLAKTDARIHVLLLTVHHVVADAWSARVLLRELSALYGAFVSGKPDPLAPLRLQFRDFACWESQRLGCGAMDQHREYWLSRLSPGPPRLALATDFRRSAQASYSGDRVTLPLPRATVAGFKEAAERNGTSTYAVVLASIFALLRRHTGQKDLTVGSQVAGRYRRELEDQIGCYLNTVVLRNRITADETMDAIVRSTGRMLMESLEHQEYPFDLLLEDLKAMLPGGNAGLFNVQADYVPPGPPQTFRVPGLEIADVSADASLVKYDLSFFTSDEPGGEMQIALEYNTGLFLRSTIERMAAHLSDILHTFVRDPRCRVSDAAGVKKTARVGLRLQ